MATSTRARRNVSKPKAQSARRKAQAPKAKGKRPKTVGMIGLGIMGSAMAVNLMRGGYTVIGYDVADACRKRHRRAGGLVAAGCADVAAAADVIVTSLPSSAALLDTAAALAASSRPPKIVIETSTLPIAVKEAARERLRACRVTLLDCPLSGTGAQAKTKDLVVYASGDRAACRSSAPVFEAFSRAHYYIGPFGDGSKMKFVANLLVAIHNVAAGEAFALGMKAGLAPALIYEVIANSAGASRMLQVRGPMMVKGRYGDATMKLEVWQKDMTIIGDFARTVGAAAPLFGASAPIYNAAMAMRPRTDDTAAVCAVLEQMAGITRRPSVGRRASR